MFFAITFYNNVTKEKNDVYDLDFRDCVKCTVQLQLIHFISIKSYIDKIEYYFVVFLFF